MFKSPAQRAAFFHAVQKQKQGLAPNAPGIQAPVQAAVPHIVAPQIQKVGPTAQPQIPQALSPMPSAAPLQSQGEPMQSKFAKLKKLMKPNI